MSDKPILFSGPMISALIAGTKTQTRRVLKLPTKTFAGNPIYERKDMGGWEPTTFGGDGTFTVARDGSRQPSPVTVGIWHRTTGVCMSAPRQVGDRLWVKETWRTESRAYDDLAPSEMGGEETILYDADADWGANKSTGKTRVSIHMPRWASRLTLIVTDVRIERLQDISEVDAIAEGCFKGKASGRVFSDEASMHFGGNEWSNARDWYADLWESINGPDAWNANPWVVAYTFTVVRQNIDQVAR